MCLPQSKQRKSGRPLNRSYPLERWSCRCYGVTNGERWVRKWLYALRVSSCAVATRTASSTLRKKGGIWEERCLNETSSILLCTLEPIIIKKPQTSSVFSVIIWPHPFCHIIPFSHFKNTLQFHPTSLQPIFNTLSEKMKRKQIPRRPQTDFPKSPPIPISIKSPKKKQIKVEQAPQGSAIGKRSATPLMGLDGSEQQISSQEKEEFLLLEIKQLKRENNFLRKKLNQLTAEFGPDRPKKPKQKGAGVVNLQILPLSINLFFQEIHNLLSTIVKLFRIEFTPAEVAKHQQQFSDEMAQVCPVKKHAILKKFYLKRKLERMMLEDQEKRFPHFLELFTEYYQFKEESDAKIIETVDRMTLRAHDLNDTLLKKAQERKKARSTFSMIRPEDEPLLDTHTLRVPIPAVSPKNHVANNKVATYSPANRKKKDTKFTMSPAERKKYD